MYKLKSKLFTLSIIALFVLSAFVTLEVYATEEDAILAEFCADPSNLLPSHLFTTAADVEVKIKNLPKTVKFSVETSIVAPVRFLSEDVGKVALYPPDEESADRESFGITSLVGNKHYLIENTTDNVYTTLDITDNFDVEQYYYLLFEDLMSKNSNTAITVKISFGKTAAANISASAETYNKTIISSEIIPIASTTWFNLILETNVTFPYVINVECANIDVSGYYVFQFDNDKLVYDTRYFTTYIDTDDTVLQMPKMSLIDKIENGLLHAYVEPRESDLIIVQGTTTDDLNATKMLSVSSQITQTSAMHVQAVGWADKDDLEDDLKTSWKTKLIQQGKITAADEINDYNITATYWSMQLNLGLTKMLKRALEQQLQSSTDYRTLVNSVLSKIIPLALVTSQDTIYEDVKLLPDGNFAGHTIDGFWSNVGDFFKNVGSGIVTVAKKIIDVPLKAIDAVKNLGGKLITTAGNVVNTVTGHVKDAVGGVVGVVGDVGKSLFSTIKIPLIIGISILGLGAVIFLFVKFGRKPA
jgi:hypothetical protein